MIGSNLKRICDARNVSMYKISKETGISQSYLSELVNGKATNPSSEILVKLSEFLEISVDALIRKVM